MGNKGLACVEQLTATPWVQLHKPSFRYPESSLTYRSVRYPPSAAR